MVYIYCCTFKSTIVHSNLLTLHCYVKYEECELAKVCIDNMHAEYHAHLKNANIIKFDQLFQKA